MKILNRILNPLLTVNQLLLLAALYLAATQNFSFWNSVLASLPSSRGPQEVLFLGVLALVLVALLVVALSLFGSRRIVRPALMLLLILASVCSYFMDAFGVVIDTSMMTNVLQTDLHETAELLSLRLCAHVLVFGVLSAWWVYRVELVSRSFLRELLSRGLLVALALLTISGGIVIRYKDFTLWARDNRAVRTTINPTYPIYSAFLNVRDLLREREQQRPLLTIAGDAVRVQHASANPRPLVVVLVVGETARAENFSLLGYPRQTNPQLSTINGLTAFSQTSSCGTSTAVSLPCMFSRLGREYFSKDAAAHQENVLDVLKRVGVEVLWRDNQSGCKGVCARIASDDLMPHQQPSICKDGECFDEILLQGLGEQIAGNGADQLIVLHQEGSHGPSYYKRYPQAFRRYTPDCVADSVQTCSQQQIVNAYDNTILYTDHVLASVIDSLQQRAGQVDAMMLYVSDHGESLGENGIYLHGLPYALAPSEQKHVPMLLWMSADAAQRQGVSRGCVAKLGERPTSHDDLFDTMLGAFAVRTAAYRPANDILQSCRFAVVAR